ncbi:hypothetical protein FRACYDRAFT_233332 [Fragilariopsis cylindrus CCMP1102]|uniref:RING-type domain-containing protein n=1 Tax=Fragilariopsis cylindrus CCMP1102 TaxID=635003 RepID=A0A1E7FZD0_9STRA|nr:hypothetical protein FRACYDRAFT_233332 [Fragilariopsis cylindrus CCMP1102]|eukprot:OEU23163.1 hypothetical protein FRACYDRAFT_233332 [Fragilariopsis cylindrus CCMP1102]
MDPLKSSNLTDGDWSLDFKRKTKGDTFDESIASRWLQQQQQQQLQRNQQAEPRRGRQFDLWYGLQRKGEIPPDLLQVVLNTGITKHVILNAARMALEREASKRQELRIQDLEEQLQQEQSNLGDGNLRDGSCVICMDEPRTNAFVTCGHVCTCQSCSNELFMMGTGTNDGRRRNRRAQCPICK